MSFLNWISMHRIFWAEEISKIGPHFCYHYRIKAHWKSNSAWDYVLHEVMHHFWQMSMEMQILYVRRSLTLCSVWDLVYTTTICDSCSCFSGCKVPSYLFWPIWQQVEKTGRQQITRLLTTPLTAPDTDSNPPYVTTDLLRETSDKWQPISTDKSIHSKCQKGSTLA